MRVFSVRSSRHLGCQPADCGNWNSCLTFVCLALDIDRDGIARRKCLFERFVE
jgi:hypothetical protein